MRRIDHLLQCLLRSPRFQYSQLQQSLPHCPLNLPPLYPSDFLAIMDGVYTFSATLASFAAAHTALAERMARTEVTVAQTTAMLTQNNAILMQIQSQLGLPQIPSSVPTQAFPAHPPAAHLAPPAASLDILAAATSVDTPLASSAAPQPARDKDDIQLPTHH